MATRHNFGFLLLNQVSEQLHENSDFRFIKRRELTGLGRWEQFDHKDTEIHLLWPLTFMNLSGEAIRQILAVIPEEKICTREDILVAIDDLSLPLGRVRIRSKGSAGGHNGLKSVEAHLGHKEYSRIKLGIGQPEDSGQIINFVLEPFTAEEQECVEDVLLFAANKTVEWLTGSTVGELSQSMNGWRADESHQLEPTTETETENTN